MSKIILPNSHRSILRKCLLHVLQKPNEAHSVLHMPGILPSLKLGEELIQCYKQHSPIVETITRQSQSPNPTPRDATLDEKTVQAPAPTTHSALLKNIATCTKCKLHGHRKKPILFPKPGLLPIIVLVDIINWQDQMSGSFFTTTDGELLIKILASIKLKRADVTITAAIKCASTVVISNQIDTIKVCLTHWHHERAILKPQWILAFGEDSYKILTGKDDFQKEQGKVLCYEESNIIYTNHPRELVTDSTLKKKTWEQLRPLIPEFAKLRSQKSLTRRDH